MNPRRLAAMTAFDLEPPTERIQLPEAPTVALRAEPSARRSWARDVALGVAGALLVAFWVLVLAAAWASM